MNYCSAQYPEAMADDHFPFVIYGVSEEDIVILIFALVATFDTATLLRLRSVSKRWRDAIDSRTKLWSRVSLRRAVLDNRIDICKLIVEYADEKNPAGSAGGSMGYTLPPLHVAAFSGQTEIFRLIFDKVDDKNPKDRKGRTPLHFAARDNCTEICRIILNVVQDKNPRDAQDGQTPLHWAARFGSVDTSSLILDVVADKNPRAKNGISRARYGWTPLHYAAIGGHFTI